MAGSQGIIGIGHGYTAAELDFRHHPFLARTRPRGTDEYFNHRLSYWPASISTPCGELFSSDGSDLFDQYGAVVQNGNRLSSYGRRGETGAFNARAGALFVPAGARAMWLFSALQDPRLSSNPVDSVNHPPLCYAELDIAGNRVIRKRVWLTAEGTTTVAATHHANKLDFWVISRPLNRSRFLCFLATDREVRPVPVISRVASFADSASHFQFSPDGRWLVYTACTDSLPVSRLASRKLRTYLARFDNATGVVSQERMLWQDSVWTRAAFSPDSRLLYLSVSDGAGYLYQYDVTADDPTDLWNNARLLATGITQFIAPLDLVATPQGQILLAGVQGFTNPDPNDPIGIITQPNLRDTACAIRHRVVAEVPYMARRIPIPNAINSLLFDTIPAIRYVAGCGSDSVRLALVNACATSVSWDFGDPTSGAANISAAWQPRHTFSASGIYVVSATTDTGQNFRTRVRYESTAGVVLPNVITPNHDGLNDTFLPLPAASGPYGLRIFNRWGAEVFATTEPTAGWDAATVADGVYFYFLTSTDCAGMPLSRRGTLTVVR